MDADAQPIDPTVFDDLRELNPEMAAKRLAEFMTDEPATPSSITCR
jgi:hypothetical protein